MSSNSGAATKTRVAPAANDAPSEDALPPRERPPRRRTAEQAAEALMSLADEGGAPVPSSGDAPSATTTTTDAHHHAENGHTAPRQPSAPSEFLRRAVGMAPYLDALRTVVVPEHAAKDRAAACPKQRLPAEDAASRLPDRRVAKLLREAYHAAVKTQAGALELATTSAKVRAAAAAKMRQDWLLLGLVGEHGQSFYVYGVSAAPDEAALCDTRHFYLVPDELLPAFHGPQFKAAACLGDTREAHLAARRPPKPLAPYGYDPRHVVRAATPRPRKPPSSDAPAAKKRARPPTDEGASEGVQPPPAKRARVTPTPPPLDPVPPAAVAPSPDAPRPPTKKRARPPKSATTGTEGVAPPPAKRPRTTPGPAPLEQHAPGPVTVVATGLTDDTRSLKRARFTNAAFQALVRARCALEEAVASRLLPTAATYRAAAASFVRAPQGLPLAGTEARAMPPPPPPAATQTREAAWLIPRIGSLPADSWQHPDQCPRPLRDLLDRIDASGYGETAPPMLARLHAVLADSAGSAEELSSVDLTTALLLAAQPEAAAAHYFWAWQKTAGVATHSVLAEEHVRDWGSRAETTAEMNHLVCAFDAAAALMRAIWRSHSTLPAPTPLLRFAAFIMFAVQRVVEVDEHTVIADPPVSPARGADTPVVSARCFITGEQLVVGDEVCLLRCRLAPDAARLAAATAGGAAPVPGLCTLFMLRHLPRALLGPSIAPASEAVGGEPDWWRRRITLWLAGASHACAVVNSKDLRPLSLPARNAVVRAPSASAKAVPLPIVEAQWAQLLETRTARAVRTLAFEERPAGADAHADDDTHYLVDSDVSTDERDADDPMDTSERALEQQQARRRARRAAKRGVRGVCTSLRLVWNDDECAAPGNEYALLTARLQQWPALDSDAALARNAAVRAAVAAMAGGIVRS